MTQLSTLAIDGVAAAHTLTNLKVWTGAGGIVSAAHRSRDGQLHGHTWEITAWWLNEPDALTKQRELTKYLSVFDHQELCHELAWGESLATAILVGMGCDKVEVRRPLERLYAVVERAGEKG